MRTPPFRLALTTQRSAPHAPGARCRRNAGLALMGVGLLVGGCDSSPVVGSDAVVEREAPAPPAGGEAVLAALKLEYDGASGSIRASVLPPPPTASPVSAQRLPLTPIDSSLVQLLNVSCEGCDDGITGLHIIYVSFISNSDTRVLGHTMPRGAGCTNCDVTLVSLSRPTYIGVEPATQALLEVHLIVPPNVSSFSVNVLVTGDVYRL